MGCSDLKKLPAEILVTAEVPRDTTNRTRLEKMCERYLPPRAFRRHLEWRHEKKGGRKGNLRTLENDGLIWSPDVAKSPCTPICLKKYTAGLIGENTNPLMLKVVDWVSSEVAHIGLWRCGEI
jgi:hypothetical protein